MAFNKLDALAMITPASIHTFSDTLFDIDDEMFIES